MLRIELSKPFRRDVKKLTVDVRRRLAERGKLFSIDPFHPQLRTHKLAGSLQNIWAFSVDYRHRVLFEFLDNETVLLLRVGDHSLYQKHG